MKDIVKNILFVFILVCIFVVPNSTFSLSNTAVSENDISVDITPEHPKAYQNTKIDLISYATDLNKAMIEWRSGNNVVLSGYGKTSYSFKTLGANNTIVFDITITPYGGQNPISKRIFVTPSEIEVFFEAVDSYTPPFYRGKALPVSGGKIKIVAFPNTDGKKNNVVYTWKLNDNIAQGLSGYNQDSFVFKNNELDLKNKVEVTASSLDNKYNAVQNIDIPIYSPEILFYEKSPTEGIDYSHNLTNDFYMNKNKEEMTLVAEPYFLPTNDSTNNFSYEWSVNGEDIETPSSKTELTIHPTDRGGYATIKLILENMNELFQKATGLIKINL